MIGKNGRRSRVGVGLGRAEGLCATEKPVRVPHMGYIAYMARERSDIDGLIDEIQDEAEALGPGATRRLRRMESELRMATEIVRLRRAQELTQKELAERSGVDQAEISRIENGKANPTYETLAALAAPLGARVGLVGALEAADKAVKKPAAKSTAKKDAGRSKRSPRLREKV